MIEVQQHSGGISVKGHAGYAPHGQDIVCAAVSTLVQNLVYSISELTATKIMHHMLPGAVEIRYGTLSETAQLLVKSFFIGMNMIAETYPNHVRIVRAVEDDIKATGNGAGVEH